MDTLNKLSLLSNEMALEPAEESGLVPNIQSCRGVVIYKALLPNGKSMNLLKTLLTSACENNCLYCPFRAGRDIRRETFQPDEFAQLVNDLFQAGLIQGIFLSSGVINGGLYTQDLIIQTAEILRFKLNYQGYLHLKIMPGSDYDQVKRSMQLADRISVNLEAPNPLRLQKLAPLKDFWQQLWQPLQWVEQIRRSQSPHLGWKEHWPSSSTQFVVGGSGESDLELLQTTESLKNELHLQRVYYSAFTPHKNTPLENQPAINLKRQERLYQAFYLLLDYLYRVSDLQFDSCGNLSLQKDPKKMWAENHLIQKPIEINKASRAELLRIPGIGPLGVKKIIESRRFNTIKDMSDLYKLGIHARQAQTYMLLNGHRPATQRSLFQ